MSSYGSPSFFIKKDYDDPISPFGLDAEYLTASVSGGTSLVHPVSGNSYAGSGTKVLTTHATGVSVSEELRLGGVSYLQGTGSPEGSTTAGVGSVYTDRTGSTGTTFYVKESGTGNTGWATQGGGGGGLPLTGGTLTGPLEVNNSSTGSGTKPTITIRDSERAVTDPFGNYALLEFTDSNDFQYFSIEKNGPFDVGGGVNIKTQGNRHLLLQGDDKILYTTAFGWKTLSDFWVGRSNLDDTVELHVEGANAGIIMHLDSSYGKISMTNIGGGAPQNKIRMQQGGSVELWNQTSSSANAQRKLITDGSGITITGRVLVSTLTPTAPGDLTTKSYVDTAIASGGGGGAAWGGITGTLSAQTDLQSALDAKLSLTGGAITGDVTFDSGNFIIQDGNNTTKLLNSNGYNSFRSYSSGGSERLLMSMQRNAGIVLYHGGAQMLTTTTNGISITGRAITNLTTPVTANELTSKDYVDTAIAAAGGGGAAWGGITGTLSAQTDLQSALDAKLTLTGGTVTGNLIVDSSTANFRMIDGNDQLRLIHGGTSTSFKTYSSGTAGQDMLTFQRTGGVNLYFSNVLKLKTTTDGIEVDGSVSLGAGSPSWSKGTGDPTGVVAAPVGSMWSRTDGGAGTTLYVKESGGGGNSGWVAK